jgi:transposase InsO family protein
MVGRKARGVRSPVLGEAKEVRRMRLGGPRYVARRAARERVVFGGD